MLPIVLLIDLQRHPLPFQLRSISALLRDFSLEVYGYDPLLSYSIEVLANLMIFNIFIKSFQSCQLFLLHPLLHNSCCSIISVSLAASWFLSVRFLYLLHLYGDYTEPVLWHPRLSSWQQLQDHKNWTVTEPTGVAEEEGVDYNRKREVWLIFLHYKIILLDFHRSFLTAALLPKSPDRNNCLTASALPAALRAHSQSMPAVFCSVPCQKFPV